MKQDVVLRVALWMIDAGPDGDAFAGDLLELFGAGRSSWWCLVQAVRRTMFAVEERLRSLLLPLWYCIGFVSLHPLWQQLYAPSVTRLLARYRGTTQWPGSAVLEIAAGLLPAVLFLWVGLFVYSLLRRKSLSIHPVDALLSLNVGSGLLFAAMMVRMHVMRNDLHLLSRADFYYPLVHARFSILLFLGLFGSVLVLPRAPRSSHRHRFASRVGRGWLVRAARSLGFVALLAPQIAAQTVTPQNMPDVTPRLLAADGKTLEFAVVSVKPSRPGAAAMSIGSPVMGDGLTISNMPLEIVFHWAFGIFSNDQIVGLPEWATQERFDVVAKVDDADVQAFRKVTDPIQRAPMLQKILVDRFGLKSHYEQKELPVYALVVAKNGIQMTEIQPAIGPNGMKDGGARQLGRGLIKSMGQPMKPLVNELTKQLETVVIDRTGLTGFYNFTLRWTPVDEIAPAEDDSAPSLPTALQEQLGLKLEHTRAPVRVLVIDHLERPSPN